ncbi:IQ and AAA domain-containing protein 1-like [Ctenocephalides felis]|uniref:IQ and AAA domain-containing protein 1-like n=1 Tax=Ctenocephalides felis TaxID=7515 RepID=UPI000E6E480B|nr:IQ and AAA domain-containing protein 1-like [Ctenocephalides felis]
MPVDPAIECWHGAVVRLGETVNQDVAVKTSDQDSQVQLDRQTAREQVADTYIRYIMVANYLDKCLDIIVQPQKRIVLRRLLDATLGRVIELKHDLVNADISETGHVDDRLSRMNATPQDAESNIPRYVRRDRAKQIAEQKNTMDQILKGLGYIDGDEDLPPMTELEAIRIIQTHERARQGRIRAQFMREIRILKEKGKQDESKERQDTALLAALRIQRNWRGFAARRRIRQRKIDEMLLIGMIPPSENDDRIINEAEKVRLKKVELQDLYQAEYEAALEDTKNLILREQGEATKERISDELRTWFKDTHTNCGKLPEFPSEEHGGSRLIFSRQGTESEMSKSFSSRDSKKSREKTKSTKSKSGKDMVEEEETDIEGFKITQSMFLPEIKNGIEEYEDTWANRDESDNPEQRHCQHLVYQQKKYEVETELRKIVDDMMRSELEQLQLALEKDRGKKSKKAPKKKSRRSGKKGKKKKEKDLTPDRTTASLFEELVTNGIIRKYPEVFMSSFLGERSIVQPVPGREGIGDIRQAIKEYCILPLGSQTIHQCAPLVKSILISGPQGSGKKMLVNAICTELGATLFDLTPGNIVGKYPGKTGLVMLMHLVNKVSRLLQPSIILMEDAEKPFVKKIPKTDRTDPKRLKKDLPKLVKGICSEDQIILIGISRSPWDADQKLLAQTYTKFITIPRPSYGCLSYAWKELLKPYSGINKQFDTSVMARISDGYTIGSIAESVREVITCKRMLQLRVRPLAYTELINALSSRDPVYREQDEAFAQWLLKTPLGKRKQRMAEMLEQAKMEQEKNANK